MLRNIRVLHSSCLYTTSSISKLQLCTNYNFQICGHRNNSKRKICHSNLFPSYLKQLPRCSFKSANCTSHSKNHHFKFSNDKEFIVRYSSNQSEKNFKFKDADGSHSNFESSPKTIDNYKLKLDPYLKLMRVDKPIGTWLLFWPGAWSILLASSPSVCPLTTTAYTLGLFLTGAFVMRGAGCTINDMWDKDIDAKVERTKDRPLVSGKISQKKALVFLAGQLSIGLSILLQLNWYSVALGASSMILVVLYPLAKRVTYYPQLVLGLCFNWGALLGWTALQGSLSPACVALYAAGVSWTLFYDTIYAHQDKRDDAIIGIKSTALKFGDSTKTYLTIFATGLVTSLTTAGILCDIQWPYYFLIGAVTTHLTRQIATLNMENPKDCAAKFVSNHHVGLLIFLGILLGKWKTWTEYFNKQEAIETFKNLDQINTLA